jgi:hypothetical protein
MTTHHIDQGIVTKFTVKFYDQTDVWVRPLFVWSNCMSTTLQQAASLNFVGDLIEDAQTAFANFLTQEHDHKAAQQGQFVYSNGTVRPRVHSIIAWLSRSFPGSVHSKFVL